MPETTKDSNLEVCASCGRVIDTMTRVKPIKYFPFDKHQGEYGLVYGAIVYTLNKTKGCAHDDEAQTLYYEYGKLVSEFTQAMLDVYDARLNLPKK